ncbi:MAG: carboxylating nicotinate-nucleotide diphosphorylase [Steroidobacteraceae bacterium]
MSRALREDIGPGDVTARLIPAGAVLSARILCREPAVLCGAAWADAAFREVDARIAVHWQARDGDSVGADTVLARVEGPARGILTAERTALNFLQLLSGTATATRQHVAAVAGTGCRILDTRKTLPGLRTAQKYAVRCGGGSNHRMGLHDMVLVKENHIAAAGSIGAAVAAARREAPGVRVEVETEDLGEFEQALEAGADVIMLDEFSLEDLRTAVARNRARGRRAELECSGGVGLERLREIAATGVDCISIGGLTKHVHAIDLSMRFESPR